MDFLYKKSFAFIKNNYFDKFFENLVYFCIIAYIFTHNISASVFTEIMIIGNISHKLMWLTFFLLMIKIAYDFLRGKFYYLESLCYFLICVLGVYVKVFNGFGDLLVFFLYIIACLDIDRDKFIKYAFYSLLISMAIVLIFGQLPYFTQFDKIEMRYGVARTRYGLGYVYTTLSANYLLGLLFLAIIYFKKFNFFHYILFIIVDIYLFIMTDTKSAFICVLLLLLLNLIVDICKNDNFTKVLGFLSYISFPIGAIAIFLLSFFYDKNIYIISKINSLTNGRIFLTYNGIKNWGIHLLGYRTNMTSVGPNYNYIDSSFMNILLNDGIIAVIIVVILFTLFAYIAYKNNNRKIIIYLFVLSLHSFLDPQLIAIPYNAFAALSLMYVLKGMTSYDYNVK